MNSLTLIKGGVSTKIQNSVYHLVMICIAILDGVRQVGFNVGDPEGELKKSLNELERRTFSSIS